MTAIGTQADIRNKLFINGEFIDAKSGHTFATVNPATEEKITDVASAGPEDVDDAVRAARAQLEPGSEWQKMKPRDRAKILWRLADMLMARAEEIGRIETIDNGKPIFESQFVDVPAAAECLYYFAGWSGKVTGETIPVADNAFAYPSAPNAWSSFVDPSTSVKRKVTVPDGRSGMSVELSQRERDGLVRAERLALLAGRSEGGVVDLGTNTSKRLLDDSREKPGRAGADPVADRLRGREQRRGALGPVAHDRKGTGEATQIERRLEQ